MLQLCDIVNFSEIRLKIMALLRFTGYHRGIDTLALQPPISPPANIIIAHVPVLALRLRSSVYVCQEYIYGLDKVTRFVPTSAEYRVKLG